MTGRSTSSNRMTFVSSIFQCLNNGIQVDVVYLDLKAAFIRVSNSLLLAKLNKLGFSFTLMEWFQSYLSNHSYRVKIGNALSDNLFCSSGVP